MKFFLCLFKNNAGITYRGMELWIHVFLTSMLHATERPAKRLERLFSGSTSHRYETPWVVEPVWTLRTATHLLLSGLLNSDLSVV
jgi:hypothetical protein